MNCQPNKKGLAMTMIKTLDGDVVGTDGQRLRQFLTSKQVRARYGVSDMSLWRWLRNEALGFPRPLRINGRRFWKLVDLEAWEDSRTEGGTDASAT
jgi:predicted DNA-binding transcriptional regulator AlpA